MSINLIDDAVNIYKSPFRSNDPTIYTMCDIKIKLDINVMKHYYYYLLLFIGHPLYRPGVDIIAPFVLPKEQFPGQTQMIQTQFDHRSVVASGGSGRGGEVGTVVNVVLHPLNLASRWCKWSTGLGRVLVESGVVGAVRAEGVHRTSQEGSSRESIVELVQSPLSSSSNLSLSASNEQRCNGVETLVDFTHDGGSVEVGSQERAGTGNDDVLGVDVDVASDESLHGTPRSGTSVPSLLGPLLRDVLKVASLLIELGADDGGDGLVVWNTTSTVCSLGFMLIHTY